MTIQDGSMRVQCLLHTRISKQKSARKYVLRLAGGCFGRNAGPVRSARIVPIWSRAVRLRDPKTSRASDFVSLTTTVRKHHV